MLCEVRNSQNRSSGGLLPTKKQSPCYNKLFHEIDTISILIVYTLRQNTKTTFKIKYKYGIEK